MKLETVKSRQDQQNPYHSEQYITKAQAYCDLLKEFADGNKEYDRLFKVLDCLKLDSNYTLALHLANNNVSFGDVSWFYCYEGDHDVYCDRFNHPNRDLEEDFFQCMGNLSEYEIFNHLSVERSEMGAWQAFLLSIALTQLPTWWHGAYRSNKLIFSNDDIRENYSAKKFLLLPGTKKKDLALTHPEEELLPEVCIEGDTAYVKYCYFNTWKGVVRQTTTLQFDQHRVTDFEKTKTDVLYEFNCGWKL